MTNTAPGPSKLAMVPFVSVENMMRIVNTLGVADMMEQIGNYIRDDFLRWNQFDKTPRVAAHSRDGVIELMPTSDGDTYGFKYVNGHPANMSRGFQTVTAFGVLARVDNGYPILLSEMTVLTALRTAATSALAARYLAPDNSDTMAMIGNGAQCEFQALAFQRILDIRTVRLFDIDSSATNKAAANLASSGLNIIRCNSTEEAVSGAQIITTCTADKQCATILTDNMVGSGVHINAIGGDCAGKTELHRDILLRADIFVEFPPQTRIEGEIQQLPQDHPVTELWQVIAEQAEGRRNGSQITLFDSVGFATEDFSALRFIRDQLPLTGHYDELDMLADPNDPCDLFGMVKRAAPQGHGLALSA
jgi:ornithine cyclodeaminase